MTKIHDTHAFLTLFSNQQGTSRYLTGELNSLWPDLRGLSLLTFGTIPHEFIQKTKPYHHVYGQFPGNPTNLSRPPFPSHPKTCYFTYDQFPFQKCSFDRIIYFHPPKITHFQFNQILRSCWETLKDDGKILLMVPNCLKWWGICNPFSFYANQKNGFFICKLKDVLKEHMFRIVSYKTILFFPYKIMNSFPLYGNKMLEFTGHFFIPFGGAYHLIEIQKQLYAPITITVTTKQHSYSKKYPIPIKSQEQS